MNKMSIFIFLNFLPSLTFAFMCPNNFSQIEVGYSMEKVIEVCGKPDVQETKELEPPVPQEWSYFIPQTVAGSSMNPQLGTLRTQFTFDESGRAINISVNGIGVGSTAICGTMVQLGDNIDRVKTICGKPSFVNRQDPTAVGDPKPEPMKMTTFIYKSAPQVKLIFQNGLLTERQQ